MIIEREAQQWHAYYNTQFELPIAYIVASHGDIPTWTSNIGELVDVEVTNDKLAFTVKVTEPGKHYIMINDDAGKPIMAKEIDFSEKDTRTFGIIYE